MLKKSLFSLWILGVVFLSESTIPAQETPNLRVVVNMVQLNVAVTDKSGKYITGLSPKDFAITEDGIAEQIATFGEGNERVRSLVAPAEAAATPGASSESADPS